MNPKLKKFLEDEPEITLMGLAWAMYWRFLIFACAIGFFLGIVAGASN